jgi:hypothetical protein
MKAGGAAAENATVVRLLVGNGLGWLSSTVIP